MAVTSKDKLINKTADTPAPAVTPQDAVPATVVARPPAPNPAPDVSKPVSVPVELNPAEESAKVLRTNILALCEEWYKERPHLTTWKEPTPDEIKARTQAAILEAGVDFTDFMAVGAIVQQVKDAIATERAASGQDKQASVDKMYGYALIGALKGIIDQVKPIVGITASKSRSPVAGGKRGRKPGSKKNNNPALIGWAAAQGMPGFILIDRTEDGMYGTFHASMAREDGRWERLNYNKDNHTYQRTGTLENSPMWWTNPATGQRPSENMRRVLAVRMLDKDGKLITTSPEINHNGKAFQVKGDYSAVCTKLGI